MKYIFYESFYYPTNTARMRTKTWLTNMVTVYTNPQQNLIRKSQKQFGEKYASYNKTTNKLYIRQRVRRATVKYINKERFTNPEFEYSFVCNTALHLSPTKGDVPTPR